MTHPLLFIGTTELMLIAGIALLLFGGKKLPEMMRGMYMPQGQVTDITAFESKQTVAGW